MHALPEWLGRDLLAGTLPWTQAVAGTLGAFLERYPVRKARWIGLYAEPEQHATLLLRWSGYWPPGEPPQTPERSRSVLAVRFDALERAEVKLRHPRIATVVSGPTNRAADAYRTHVVDRHGGDATLVHSPGIRLLWLGRSREILPILVPAEML